MRFRKRHAWGTVLIVLFALPLVAPRGLPFVERPIARTVSWPARATALNPNSWRAEGECKDDARTQTLQNELMRLWERHLAYVRRHRDLGALKRTLDAADLSRPPQAIAAHILRAHDAARGRRSVTLDQGTAAGVVPGLPVVMGHVYLGRVRWAFEHMAIVQLVTDPRSKLEVFVRTDRGTLLRGWTRRDGTEDGRDRLRLEFVRLEDDEVVKLGAPVFTANFNEQVPAGLLVGTVSAVEDPDQDRMPTLHVMPALDLDRAADAVVLAPPAEVR